MKNKTMHAIGKIDALCGAKDVDAHSNDGFVTCLKCLKIINNNYKKQIQKIEQQGEKFFNVIGEIRKIADKVEKTHGKNEVWWDLFNLHNSLLFVPPTKKDIEWGMKLAKELGLKKETNKGLN